MSTKTPFFTIITPVFNGAHFLPGLIASVTSQSYVDWEHIIVDDSSTDGTFLLASSLAFVDSRIRIYSNFTNKTFAGPHSARNMAIDHALGKFILFLDVDDRWLPDHLFTYYHHLTLHQDIHLVFSDYYRFSRANNVSFRCSPVIFFTLKFTLRFANPIPLLTSCINSSLARSVSFPDHAHEDFLYWNILLSLFPRTKYSVLRHPTAIYSVHAFSLSSDKLKSFKWILQCYSKMGYNRFAVLCAVLIRGFYYLMAKSRIKRSFFLPPQAFL